MAERLVPRHPHRSGMDSGDCMWIVFWEEWKIVGSILTVVVVVVVAAVVRIHIYFWPVLG